MFDEPDTYLYEGREPLRLSEVFRGLLSSGVVVLDGEHRVIEINQTAGELVGIDPANPKGATLSDLPLALQTLVKDFSGGSSNASLRQIALTLPSGESREIQAELLKCADEASRLPNILMVLNNVGSVQALEAHIRRLDRLANIGALSASAAHEIKNCLVTIKTFLDTMLEKSDDTEMTDLVKREVKRIDGTASQLLKFSGPSSTERTALSMRRLLGNTLKLVQHQMEQRGIELVEELRCEPDEVLADENLLSQAFINLFFNAIEAIKGQGRIRVSTSLKKRSPPSPGEENLVPAAERDWIAIAIEDTGEGIAPEKMKHLFNRFFTTKPNGTGLGLAITHRIIEEHQGEINVESEVGKGSRFEILLPLTAG